MIPHSANIRILENVCDELGFPKEKCLQSVTDYGNTSAASIPIAWYNGVKDGKLQQGIFLYWQVLVVVLLSREYVSEIKL